MESLYILGGVLIIGAVSGCTQSQPIGPASAPPPLAIAASSGPASVNPAKFRLGFIQVH